MARPPDHPENWLGRGRSRGLSCCCAMLFGAVGAARLVPSDFWRAAASAVGLPPSPCQLYPAASRVETSARCAPLTRRGRVPLPIAAERIIHTMTRHTTIRRSDVAGLLPRGAYTAGVPLTSAQAAVISALISMELCSRKYGHGQLPVTDEALADEALRAIVQLMDRAITDISVLRDTPQRQKR